MKRFILYLVKWQSSTIILAPCIALFSDLGPVCSAIIANFIGGCLYFPIDSLIFKPKKPMKYLVVKDGHVRTGFNLLEDAEIYAKQINGYVIENEI